MFGYVLIGAASVLAIAGIATLVSAFFTVKQRTIAIVQPLGKFVREAEAELRAESSN